MKLTRHSDHKTESPRLTNFEIFDLINHDINWKRVYCAYFQSIASIKTIPEVNLKRAAKWIEAELAEHIVTKYSSERCGRDRKPDREEVVYVLDNQCIVHIGDRGCSVSNVDNTLVVQHIHHLFAVRPSLPAAPFA